MIKFLLPFVGLLWFVAACHNRVVIEHAREVGATEGEKDVPYQVDSISVAKAGADSVLVVGTSLKDQISAEGSSEE